MEETNEPYDINYILDILYKYNFKLGGNLIECYFKSRQPQRHHKHFPGLFQEFQIEIQGSKRPTRLT